MWKIIPECSYSTEPTELQELKLQLANNTCKCKLCATYTASLQSGYICYDKEVQVTNIKSFLDRCSQASQHTIANTFHKEVFCPGCYMAMSLLSNQYPKVLKDEQSEIKPELNCSEKSTENLVKFAEQSTSIVDESELTPEQSKLSLYDMRSEYSTDKSTFIAPKRINDKVTFQEIPVEIPKITEMSCNCLCIDNFVNSIRPPLAQDFMRF